MSKKLEEDYVDFDSEADFVDYCLEVAIRQGRVQKRGNLAKNEQGEYIGEITYTAVLN